MSFERNIRSIKTGKSIIYLNIEGEEISKDEWLENRTDEMYRFPHAYENDRFRVEVEFHGKINKANKCPSEYWQPYRVNFHNAIEKPDGTITYRLDVINSVEASDYKEAFALYQKYLDDYTECYLDEEEDDFGEKTGEKVLVEKGNHLEERVEKQKENINTPKYSAYEDDAADTAGSW